MRRLATAAAIGLLGVLLLLSPATPAGAAGTSAPSQPGVTVDIVSNAATCRVLLLLARPDHRHRRPNGHVHEQDHQPAHRRAVQSRNL